MTPPKNPSAVALGRIGGRIGGPARAAKLTPERRQEIARMGGLKKKANAMARDAMKETV